MPFFDDRDRAFEAKYQRDEEHRFKVQMRRDKLFGEWLGRILGFSKPQTHAYVRSLMEADLYLSGERGILAKVQRDCSERGLEISRHRLEGHLQECRKEAERELTEAR